MAKKIWWDPGHGGKDPGCLKDGLMEKELVLKIVKYAMAYVNANYIGHEQRATRLTDVTVELDKRDDPADAWGADVFVSVHINAGGGNGFESYVYNGLSAKAKPAAISLQNAINAEVLGAMRKFGDIKPHGGDMAREANFSVLRETDMPAVLTENLYIDSSDIKYLKKEDFLKAVGEAHGRAVAKFLGLAAKPVAKPPETKPPEVVYKVQVGAFSSKANAEKLAKALLTAGYKSTIVEVKK